MANQAMQLNRSVLAVPSRVRNITKEFPPLSFLETGAGSSKNTPKLKYVNLCDYHIETVANSHFRDPHTEMVDIIVFDDADKKATFRVHKEFICFYSDFFNAAFSTGL